MKLSLAVPQKLALFLLCAGAASCTQETDVICPSTETTKTILETKKNMTKTNPEQAALDASRAWLEEHKKCKGVKVTSSGLQYTVTKQGDQKGANPKPQDRVRVHYEGRLLDGTVFDSSYKRGEPAVFPVGALIPGWVEALQLMKPGDVWEISLSTYSV